MAKKDMQLRLFSAQEVADQLGLDDSGVRRLALQHGIGQKFGERMWAFTDSDIQQFRDRPATGRPPKAPPTTPAKKKRKRKKQR